MKEQQIISELDSIIAHACLLKEKATELRKKLAPVEVGASPKRGRKKAVSDEEIARVLARRQKFRNRKMMKTVDCK